MSRFTPLKASGFDGKTGGIPLEKTGGYVRINNARPAEADMLAHRMKFGTVCPSRVPGTIYRKGGAR